MSLLSSSNAKEYSRKPNFEGFIDKTEIYNFIQ